VLFLPNTTDFALLKTAQLDIPVIQDGLLGASKLRFHGKFKVE
jgi:hypothetical protein